MMTVEVGGSGLPRAGRDERARPGPADDRLLQAMPRSCSACITALVSNGREPRPDARRSAFVIVRSRRKRWQRPGPVSEPPGRAQI